MFLPATLSGTAFIVNACLNIAGDEEEDPGGSICMNHFI